MSLVDLVGFQSFKIIQLPLISNKINRIEYKTPNFLISRPAGK